jgi:hypothetical protein
MFALSQLVRAGDRREDVVGAPPRQHSAGLSELATTRADATEEVSQRSIRVEVQLHRWRASCLPVIMPLGV